MSGKAILIISDDESVRKHIEEVVSISREYVSAAPIHGFPEPGETYSLILLSESALDNNPMRLETLRSQHPASPVIILGNYPTSDHRPQLSQLDIFSYLPANASSEEIIHMIRRAYDHHTKLENWAAKINIYGTSQEKMTTLADGLISSDADGNVQILNAAAKKMLQVTNTEWIGKPLQSIIPFPKLVDAILTPPSSGSVRLMLQSDSKQAYSAQVFPIPDGGKVTTLHNITNFRELEVLKKELIQTISHDLRSPLTAILGYAELIGKVGEVNERQLDFIHRVQLSVNTIVQLIDSLLALGAIEADFEVPSEMVQIGDVLNQSVQMLHPLLDEKAQTMRLEIPDDLPCVRGKAIWLRQMINNLIENAHKYSPENSDIAIKLKNEGDQILLQVIDSGIGIPTSEIPYIFDKHYRGSNLPLDSDGTGLGLAFVKSIVDNHNGRLWCESNENNGTTFTIMLPAAEPII